MSINDNKYKIERVALYRMDGDDVGFSINDKYHLVENGVPVTQDYWGLANMGDDHFDICDINVMDGYVNINDICYENLELKFKHGVIKLQRDKNGNIIPFAEKLVVPVVYDRISGANEDALIAYSNGKLTYIDLNPQSENYGKQLVPAVLDQAVPFNVTYNGFAECSVDGVNGYLPRNIRKRKELSGINLLTEAQVIYLLQRDDDLAIATDLKLNELTGSPKVLVKKPKKVQN